MRPFTLLADSQKIQGIRKQFASGEVEMRGARAQDVASGSRCGNELALHTIARTDCQDRTHAYCSSHYVTWGCYTIPASRAALLPRGRGVRISRSQKLTLAGERTEM